MDLPDIMGHHLQQVQVHPPVPSILHVPAFSHGSPKAQVLLQNQMSSYFRVCLHQMSAYFRALLHTSESDIIMVLHTSESEILIILLFLLILITYPESFPPK